MVQMNWQMTTRAKVQRDSTRVGSKFTLHNVHYRRLRQAVASGHEKRFVP